MIFIHKESGEIYELLLHSIDADFISYLDSTGEQVFRMAKFVMHGNGEPRPCKYSDMPFEFEFIGFI